MAMAVCRRCPNCKLYSDITVEICMCGYDLSKVKQLFIDTDKDTFKDKLGEINDSLSYYVQRCSTCGELNYTTSKSKPFLRCYKCSKTMIASVAPASIINNDLLDKPIEKPVEKDSQPKKKSAAVSLVRPGRKKSSVKKSEKTSPSNVQNDVKLQTTSKPVDVITPPVSEPKPVLDEVAGVPVSPPVLEPKISKITLTAVNNNNYKCVVNATDAKTPVVLGREALLGDYLKSDKRVGKAHCSLIFHNKIWYVADNKSANGTFLNNRDIGYQGVEKLKEGDKIKFGHSSDSLVVIVSISD